MFSTVFKSCYIICRLDFSVAIRNGNPFLMNMILSKDKLLYLHTRENLCVAKSLFYTFYSLIVICGAQGEASYTIRYRITEKRF